MTRSLTLPDFSAPAASVDFTPQVPEAAPDLADSTDALESYDSGYKSGWADAVAAEAEERSTVSADLAKNLSDAELTYEAARRDVLAALGPFFEDVATTLLPQMAAAAVVPTVLAELGALAERQTESKIEIHAAPSACAALERLGEAEPLSGLIVRPEPAFAEGQVSIRVGSEQRDLDMASAASKIADALAEFGAQTPPSEILSAVKGAA